MADGTSKFYQNVEVDLIARGLSICTILVTPVRLTRFAYSIKNLITVKNEALEYRFFLFTLKLYEIIIL